MGPPDTLPAEIAAAHAGWTTEVAWTGELGLTWRLSSRDGHVRYAKVTPAGVYPPLAAERDRMEWAARWITVPHVVAHDTDGEREWLITAALEGRDATIVKDTMEPEALVTLLGAALRTWHDTLPVAECPFDFRLDVALAHCRRRVSEGQASWDGLRGRNDRLTPSEALAELEGNRPVEDLVVCHGDFCFPNVFLTDGRVTGFLDLGELGVADRWWDIAIGAWSTTWNVDPKHEPLFYEGYGIQPDPQRIAYYRLLYEVAG